MVQLLKYGSLTKYKILGFFFSFYIARVQCLPFVEDLYILHVDGCNLLTSVWRFFTARVDNDANSCIL